MSEYNEFVKTQKAENPGISMQDIGKAWQEQKAGKIEGVKTDPETTTEPDKELAPLDEETVIRTTTRTLSDVVKEKLDQLKDLATMEILLPVHTRMKKRMESLKKISSASHIKVRGHHKTTAPQIHISGLTGKKVTNDECQISFGVYDVDENNNKKEYKNYSEVEKDGQIVKKHLSSEYRIKFEIIETIRTNKAITREKMIIERING